jgi:uncharacterized coiled-coil protein SlyX
MVKRKSTYNIPERFLRQIWMNQHLSSINLRASDNQSIVIISTGKYNQDSGPDFLDACLRFNNVTYRGDVEVHQRNEEWYEHQHHKDPKYNSVILHVVLHSDLNSPVPTTQSKRTISVLALDNYLTSTYRSTWEQMILDERAERLATLKCFTQNDSLDGSLIQKWLNKLAVARIELKVRRFEERLKEMIHEEQLHVKEPPPHYSDIPFGLSPEELPPPMPKYSRKDYRNIHFWEQLLYEGVMEALGYSKNQAPFLKLSRNVRLGFYTEILPSLSEQDRILHIESILFAVANLLPSRGEKLDDESKKYVHPLKSIWKQYQKLYHRECLNKSEWQFFRLRPDNFPTVRIAGASRLIQRLSQEVFFKSIIQITKDGERKRSQKFSDFEKMFIVPADGFWSTHYRFGELSSKIIPTLIGKSRADEIILNVVIPICLLYARIFKDKDVRQGTLKIFEQSPPLSDNTVIKIVDNQLIKGRLKLQSAMLQQGALQLYKFYCVENRCNDCSIGKTLF